MRGEAEVGKRSRRIVGGLIALAALVGGPVACGSMPTTYEDRPVTELPGDDDGLDDPWAWPSEVPSPGATGSASPAPLSTPEPSTSSAQVTWVAEPLPPPGNWLPGGLAFSGTLVPGADTIPSRVLWQISTGGQIQEVDLLPEGRFSEVGSRYVPDPTTQATLRGQGPVACDAELVVAAPGGNLVAWMRESRASLRLGKPFADRVQALALTPSTLWVAREGRVVPFRRDRLEPDTASTSYVLDTRAIAGGPDGSLWLGLPGNRVLGLEPGGQVRDFRVSLSGEWRGLTLDEEAGFVICLFRDALCIADRAGNPVFSTQAGYFQDASSVCVLPEGDLLVSDAGSRRLTRFRVVNTGLPADK
jgi:hypothetical protein